MRTDNKFHTVRGYHLMKQGSGRDLTPSMEDYLEMIYRTSLQRSSVRVNMLAEQLNVQAPSVSRTVRRLAKKGYVSYQKYGEIELTPKGRRLGQYLLKRHETVEQFLNNLGATSNLLVETELIEHYLSPHTVEVIESWNAFLAANTDILRRLNDFRAGVHCQ